MAERPETTHRDAVNHLARTMDPEAWEPLPRPSTMGAIWDQKIRRMVSIEHAWRAVAAGWAPREQARPGMSKTKQCR